MRTGYPRSQSLASNNIIQEGIHGMKTDRTQTDADGSWAPVG